MSEAGTDYHSVVPDFLCFILFDYHIGQ